MYPTKLLSVFMPDHSFLSFQCVIVFMFLFLTWPPMGSLLVSARLNPGDSVSVAMNKVSPYHNPLESYPYYSAVPFCKPDKIEFESMSFGQVLRGDRLANSAYTITYMVPVEDRKVCTVELNPKQIAQLKSQIKQMYMFEIFVDDLPVTKPLGFYLVHDDQYLVPTHYNFHLGFNDGHVVSANISVTDRFVTLPADPDPNQNVTLNFRYSVSWFSDATPVQARLYKQVAGALGVTNEALDIHWLAITNSFIFVLFITAVLLLIILRVVRTDLAKYLHIPDEELSVAEDESGWKLLHADVFRPPVHRMWFCACVGSGAHIFFVTLVVALNASFSAYVERGTLLTSALFGYLLTSFVAGYISANLYRRLGGLQWKLNVLVTIFMFMGPVALIWSALNTIAVAYKSTTALPFSITSTLVFCWFFVTLPLTVFGAMLGRYRASKAVMSKTVFPCKTNRLAREIPMTHWRHSPWLHVILSGFVPFGAIYMELHYVFMSLWGPYMYTLYGVLLCAFAIHLLVAGTVSILLTYFHLHGEDYKWWWRSFVSGGSVALFFMLHSLYYFLTGTNMFGFLQCTFFFGFSLIVAWAIFLMLGFVTFAFNYWFVTYIYSSIKSD